MWGGEFDVNSSNQNCACSYELKKQYQIGKEYLPDCQRVQASLPRQSSLLFPVRHAYLLCYGVRSWWRFDDTYPREASILANPYQVLCVRSLACSRVPAYEQDYVSVRYSATFYLDAVFIKKQRFKTRQYSSGSRWACESCRLWYLQVKHVIRRFNCDLLWNSW